MMGLFSRRFRESPRPAPLPIEPMSAEDRYFWEERRRRSAARSAGREVRP